MNITCIICSDTILPHAEIYTTQCGHLFHYTCLIQWIERSKTCPQCRNKTTEKNIHRIYFNLTNTDSIVDDVGTLQHKLDNLQFRITLKEKDISIYKEKYNKTKNQNIGLRREVAELENKIRVHESIVAALKDQISFFKARSKERDRLVEELTQMKNKLKELELVQIAVNGTREQVNDLLRNETNIESLVILSATLKKALLDVEQKKFSVEHKFKKLQNEVGKYRRDIATLETANEELRKELERSKLNWKEEKNHLTKVVENIKKKGTSGSTPVIKRILSESPIPVHLKSSENSNEIINLADSPSVEEKVKEVLDSSSPYLQVKTSNINPKNCEALKSFLQTSPNAKKMSIFRGAPKTMNSLKSYKSDEVVYNGLGGQSKQDIFPSPKTTTGIKRIKISSMNTSSSAKLRKLNPTAFTPKKL